MIRKVVLSKNTEEIGDRTFSYCENLQSIDLPNSVKKIGESAFLGDKALSSINLTNVEEIGSNAFSQCTGIESLTISSKTQKMGAHVFERWGENQTINVFFTSSETPPNWNTSWNDWACNAKINYKQNSN